MTPKEKAEELLNKFNNPDRTNYPYVHNAQQCALIAVNEILAIFYDDMQSMWNDELSYWHQVKNEIENL